VHKALSVRLQQVSPIPLDIDFTVEEGETLALVGPSGAGKTTILRAIAGLAHIEGGAVHCGEVTWLDAERGVNVPARHRKVGMVFQSYALFPHLSAQANVEEAMFHLPAQIRSARATELLARVQLDGLCRRVPAALSGGQQQRVALARALARDPAVLLLDEPLSAVDQPTRRALHRLLADIRQQLDIPIITVTHDVDDALRLADNLCFIEGGRQREFGPATDLLANPLSSLRIWLDG